MPSLVKEVTQGHSKSKAGGGVEAGGSGRASRVFRVILSAPGEIIDAQEVCGVSIGSAHPEDAGFACTDYASAYEGESRIVLNVTFNYALVTNQTQNGQPPDVRPANWSLGSALYEKPATSWAKRTSQNTWGGFIPAANSAGDIYDGITYMDAMVTISIQQFCTPDPTVHAMYVGDVNEEQITLGSLVMEPHTVMLRGINAVPTVEAFDNVTYKGWTATYEFAYKRNTTSIHFGANGAGGFVRVPLGWDIAVPQTGFNVRAFNPQAATPIQDSYGQPLKHGKAEDGEYAYRIKEPLELPSGVAAQSKQRAMVMVFSYENGGASQTPSALPIPLNDDGTPRLVSVNNNPDDPEAGVRPLVYGYQVHRATNFTQTLQLRLQ